MSHTFISSFTISRLAPSTTRLHSAEQAVAYLAAAVLRGGGDASPAQLELLRGRCAELDAVVAAGEWGAA